MGWIDDRDDCHVCPITNSKKCGLQLILDIEDIDRKLPTHLRPQWWNNIVTRNNKYYWKKQFGVRLTLHSKGVKFLEEWFDSPIPRALEKFSRMLIQSNITYIKDHTCYASRVKFVYPPIDFIDFTYVQRGLDGALWSEFPEGIRGISVDITDPYKAYEGWIPVTITKDFACAEELQEFLPCTGILTWDK
jgi:hypothetical protein